VAVEQLLGLEESNETEVQRPDIEKMAHLLQDRRSVCSVALTGLFLLKNVAWIPEAAGALTVMLAGLAFAGLLVYELSVPIAQWITRAPPGEFLGS